MLYKYVIITVVIFNDILVLRLLVSYMLKMVMHGDQWDLSRLFSKQSAHYYEPFTRSM